MTFESRPEAGAGVRRRGMLQVEGTARVRVLRQRHKHCIGGKPWRPEGEVGERQESRREMVGAGSSWGAPEPSGGLGLLPE